MKRTNNCTRLFESTLMYAVRGIPAFHASRGELSEPRNVRMEASPVCLQGLGAPDLRERDKKSRCNRRRATRESKSVEFTQRYVPGFLAEMLASNR